MDWTGPVTALAVAIVAASGAWLTYNAAKSAQRAKREDLLQRRIIRIINYAQRLRAKLEEHDIPPEAWPDNLYDSEDK